MKRKKKEGRRKEGRKQEQDGRLENEGRRPRNSKHEAAKQATKRESLSLSLCLFKMVVRTVVHGGGFYFRWQGGNRHVLDIQTLARLLSPLSDSLVPQTTTAVLLPSFLCLVHCVRFSRSLLLLSLQDPPNGGIQFHAVINYVSFAFQTDIVARAPGMRIPGSLVILFLPPLPSLSLYLFLSLSVT